MSVVEHKTDLYVIPRHRYGPHPLGVVTTPQTESSLPESWSDVDCETKGLPRAEATLSQSSGSLNLTSTTRECGPVSDRVSDRFPGMARKGT